MVVEQRLITIEEYEIFLADHPDGRYELIHGEIVEKHTSEYRGVLLANIAGEYYLQCRHIIGHGGISVDYMGDEHNIRCPDFSVHLTDKPVVKKGAVQEMPNLAVEIKSPTNSYKGLREKAAYYLENGCQMVWLVYPEKRIVEVYQPDRDLDILLENDTLSGNEVLPGFTLSVATILS